MVGLRGPQENTFACQDPKDSRKRLPRGMLKEALSAWSWHRSPTPALVSLHECRPCPCSLSPKDSGARESTLIDGHDSGDLLLPRCTHRPYVKHSIHTNSCDAHHKSRRQVQ